MENPEKNNAIQGYFLLILSISLAVFMSSLDGTIVNIALPAITETFGITTTTVSWVATSYLLVEVGCVLIFGKMADTIGYKKIFLSGFFVFTLGSFFCGFIPEFIGGFPSLVLSRVLQAVGGAMLMAVAAAMITAYIPAEQKGKAMSIVMLCASLGTAIGPTIGGVLTQHLSWHWIFFINVPVGIIAILLGAKVIPESQPTTDPTAFDKAGAGLVFVGLASLVFVVSEGETFGWTSPVILGVTALTIITLGWFVKRELGLFDPLLDLRLFRNRNFFLANLLLGLVFLSFSGIEYLLPFFLQYVHNYDTSTAGLILSSLAFAMMISGIIAGAAFNRTGPRRLCIIACIPMIIGYYMMTMLDVHISTAFVVVSLALIGFGLGLLVTPLTSLIMMSVSKTKAGMVSSLTSLERQAPCSIGIAIYNLLLIESVIMVAKSHAVTLQSPKDIQLEVLSAGFDLAFTLSLVLGIIIFVIALLIKEEIHPDYEEEAKILRHDMH
ncbi:MAG TPA: DHA2 family efflux MFS transporter permease subunit [Methanoregula sp.]|nr:DHA2 family efflux MFS transporter permease subunit [Methanoregula sp.]